MIDMSVHNFLDENCTSACDKNILPKVKTGGQCIIQYKFLNFSLSLFSKMKLHILSTTVYISVF